MPAGLLPREVPSSWRENDSDGATAPWVSCAKAGGAASQAAMEQTARTRIAPPLQAHRVGLVSPVSGPHPGDQRMLDPKTIRNVAIIAHDGAGKTCLTEALLRHDAPARASKDGSTSHLDVDPEESKRNFTVATHITYAEHEGTLLNLLDAPGFSDFLTDADRSMAVCEGGLLLVSAVSGVKHQTEAHWDMAAERSLPLLACVNKLDKERASYLRALDDIEKTLNAKPVALQLPVGLAESFTGVVELITMRAHAYTRKADGRFGGFILEGGAGQLLGEG